MMASSFKDFTAVSSATALRSGVLSSSIASNPSFSSSTGHQDESSSVQSSSESKSLNNDDDASGGWKLINHSRRKKATPANQTPKLPRKEIGQQERALIDALPLLTGEKSLLFSGGATAGGSVLGSKQSSTNSHSRRFVNRKESLVEYPPLNHQKSPLLSSQHVPTSIPRVTLSSNSSVTAPAVVVSEKEPAVAISAKGVEFLKPLDFPPLITPDNTLTSDYTFFAFDIAKRALDFLILQLSNSPEIKTFNSIYTELQQNLLKLDEIKRRQPMAEHEASRLLLGNSVEEFSAVKCSSSDDTLANLKPSVPYKERKEEPPEQLIIMWSESSSEDEAVVEPPKKHTAATSTTTPKKSWADIVSLTKSPLAKVLTLEKIEEKLTRAEEAREQTKLNRARKLQTVDEKIREARYNREKERSEAQKRLEERLNRAQDRRINILQSKTNRSREERDKQKAEADVQQLHSQKMAERQAKAEARQKELEEERLRKLEESAAKNEAALVRRSALEQERLAKLQTIEEKRRELEARKQQERQALLAAREAEKEEKARRLAEFKSEKEENVEELRKVITTRIEKVSKRHEELLEQVKEKAAAVTEHSREVAERTQALRKSKVCLVCKEEVFTDDEVSRKKRDHVHSFESIIGQDQGSEEAVRPKQKNKRKKNSTREKKRSALSQLSVKDLLAAVRRRLHEFNIDSTVENFNDLDMTCIAFESRLKQETKFSREKLLSRDDIFSMGLALQKLEGVDSLFSLGWISYVMDVFFTFYSTKSMGDSVEAPLIFDQKYLSPIIDGVFRVISAYALPKCQACGTDEYLVLVAKCTEFMRLCLGQKAVDKRVKQSIIDHVVSSKCLHSFHNVFVTVHGPLDLRTNKPLISFINSVLGLLFDSTEQPAGGQISDALLCEIRDTELVGLVMLLDSMLLYPGNSKNIANTTEELPVEILQIVLLAVHVLNNIARVDLKTLQTVLGKDPSACDVNNQEALSVLQTEFFHFIRFCLQYCTSELSITMQQAPPVVSTLLNEVIVLIGYYVKENPSNQCLLRFGQYPVVLQLMARLPFPYFCNPRLQYIVFPTLMLACYKDEDNLMILDQELSVEHLEQFFKTHIDLNRNQTADSSRRKLMDDLDSRFQNFEWDKALVALKP